MKNATSIALSIPKNARRAALHRTRAALIGKTQRHRCPFEAVYGRATKAAKRRARSRYPLSRAKYLLYARATAATLKQTAAANARLNRVVHMSRSYDCRRERDQSLCHRRLYCRVLWPVMAEAARYSWDCPGEFDLV